MNGSGDVKLTWGVKVIVRDGIALNATLYFPRHQIERVPVIVLLTPYVTDTYHERGMYFASHGFPFLIVDSRGRGESEGVFRPFIQEAQDGHDVVEWLAQQPYCNGKVAMWGGSYNGYDQWAVAKELPPHLATIVPVASAYCGIDFPMRGNIFYPYVMQWLTLVSGRTYQEKLFGDSMLWAQTFRHWHESGQSLAALDSFVGNPSRIFQEWIDHPEPDSYWDAYNPTTEQYSRLHFPILTITGSYDDDQLGALEHYRRHTENVSREVRAQHYLIIGPWNHMGTRTPQAEFGGLRFGAKSLLDIPKLHLDWYAWTMQGGKRPAFLQKLVAYYVMGADRWRYAESLAAITYRQEVYFLDSDRNANNVLASGTLSLEAGRGAPDSYRYDPRDTSGLEVQLEAEADYSSLVDQSVVYALPGKALVYHSAPFEQEIEISGFFRLDAWLSIDCPDTDVYATVFEICRDGSSIRLSSDLMRARYREGLRTPKLLTTADPLPYRLERFTFVSRRINRGHRLRLVIAPVGRPIEAAFAERNFNTGGIVARESIRDAKTVTLKLFHDDQHPSYLTVPIGHPVSFDEGIAPASAFLTQPNTSR